MSDAMDRAERRRRRRRRWFGLLLIAVLVASFFLIRCGGGFGIGGGGGRGVGRGTAKGLKRGPAAVVTDAGPRCRVRVSAAGVRLDGDASSIAAVVAACRQAGGAEVIVTGDARQGQWDELRAALDAAAVPAFVNGAGRPTPTLDAGN